MTFLFQLKILLLVFGWALSLWGFWHRLHLSPVVSCNGSTCCANIRGGLGSRWSGAVAWPRAWVTTWGYSCTTWIVSCFPTGDLNSFYISCTLEWWIIMKRLNKFQDLHHYNLDTKLDVDMARFWGSLCWWCESFSSFWEPHTLNVLYWKAEQSAAQVQTRIQVVNFLWLSVWPFSPPIQPFYLACSMSTTMGLLWHFHEELPKPKVHFGLIFYYEKNHLLIEHEHI